MCADMVVRPETWTALAGPNPPKSPPRTGASRRQYLCPVVWQEKVGADVFELWLQAPDMTRAAAGQFVHILTGDGYLRRPFSIYDDEQDTIGILYRVKGTGTRWMTRLAPGDYLDVVGPLGNGFATPSFGERVLLVGGGVGVAPLARFAHQHPLNIVGAVMGFRDGDAVAGIDPFVRNDHDLAIVTETGDMGDRGRVTDILADRIAVSRPSRILTCGPDPMMRAVSEVAETLGIPCEISVERHMGCGIGICLGCVVPVQDSNGSVRYDRSCVEGPVFQAREVAW